MTLTNPIWSLMTPLHQLDFATPVSPCIRLQIVFDTISICNFATPCIRQALPTVLMDNSSISTGDRCCCHQARWHKCTSEVSVIMKGNKTHTSYLGTENLLLESRWYQFPSFGTKANCNAQKYFSKLHSGRVGLTQVQIHCIFLFLFFWGFFSVNPER